MMNYKSAKIAEDANIAKQSVIIGDVTIGRDSCVLYYSVLRGDEAPIVIGEETNIQENCTVHVSRNMPVRIGNNVTVGHNAVIHSCTIGDRTLIGMGAVILDGAQIGNDCIIGAGSLVTKNTIIPDGSLVMGSPAKIKRNLTWEEKLGNLENSKEYVSVSREMKRQGGVSSMKVKRVKVQKQMILQEEQLLSENEYHKLIRTAYKKGQKSLGMIMETIATTGIRISELKYFTVGAVRRGNIIIHNKGKIRRILIPGAIRKKLLYYCFIHKINDGIIFITKNGNAQNRSNIWTQMKKLSKAAGIAVEKVYPHAFRHLFARMYYQLTSDISGLADILGHSSIETTRIYTADSEQKYLASMERLELLLSDIRLPEEVTE